MFTQLGKAVHSHAKLVLMASLVLVLAAAFIGIHTFDKLKLEGFEDPSSQSSQAKELINQKFGGSTNLIFLVHANRGTIDNPAVVHAARALVNQVVTDKRMDNVASYWTTQSPALRSVNKQNGLIVAHLKNMDVEVARQVIDQYQKNNGPINVQLGGLAAANSDISTQVGKDLALAETIAIPITLLLLLWAFGSIVSALLPLAIGIVAIFGTFAELYVIGSVTDTSIYAINLTTALSLALAVDYALFIVSRFREELSNGANVEAAVALSVATAGRTVLFSAATVATALASLAIFPLYFLRSFAYAGIGVVAISAFSAIVILPALLSLLGKRIEAGRLPLISRTRSVEAPFWRHVAGFVMKHPALTAVPALLLLLVVASPLRHITFGMPDERVLPTSATSRQVSDVLRSDFNGSQGSESDVVLTGVIYPVEIVEYARHLSTLPNVERVNGSAGIFQHGQQLLPVSNVAIHPDNAVLLAVHARQDNNSDAAQNIVKNIRDLSPPTGTRAYVGGQAAALVDSKHAISQRLPIMVSVIVAAMFIILFLFTGSLIQPLRAVVLNSFTLAATIGAVVWIFQDGHLHELLGFTAMPTNIPMSILLFCIAFGLSMDYEVFLLSRIKEMHDSGANTADSVAHGLARAGRIVSTAAGLLAVSFFAFASARVSFLQFFGVGAGLAVLMDASLMRGVLVPVFMHLFGEHAWYAPKLLKRLHAKIGIND